MPIQNAINNACVSQTPISQTTVLAMLKSPSIAGLKIGQIVQYIDPKGVTGNYRVNAVGASTVDLEIGTSIVTVPTKGVTGNQPPVFLDKIPLNQWSITSFDPRSKTVCVAINNGKITENVTVNLPAIR